MIKIDLITGFLGSGKTTFIKKYARYFTDSGKKIGILENDHGAVNVDMMLLQDLMGENCDLEMIAGGCDRDCHIRRFKTKLIAMGMRGYDRVLIEPSGIFDVDEFFDILHEEPIDKWFEIGSVITIVDGNINYEMPEKLQYILSTQVAEAGVIIISKINSSFEEKKTEVRDYLNALLKRNKSRRVIGEEIICKVFDAFSEKDYSFIADAGYKPGSILKKSYDFGSLFETLYYMNTKIPQNLLMEKIKAIFSDSRCGEVLRIKGFTKTQNSWIEINATANEYNETYISNGQEIIIVIGNSLLREQIDRYLGCSS